MLLDLTGYKIALGDLPSWGRRQTVDKLPKHQIIKQRSMSIMGKRRHDFFIYLLFVCLWDFFLKIESCYVPPEIGFVAWSSLHSQSSCVSLSSAGLQTCVDTPIISEEMVKTVSERRQHLYREGGRDIRFISPQGQIILERDSWQQYSIRERPVCYSQ